MNGKEWHPGTAASADKGYCGFAASEIYIFGILLFLQGDNGSNAFRQFHIAFGCVAAEADPFVVCLALVQCDGATAKGNTGNGFGIDDLMETDAFVAFFFFAAPAFGHNVLIAAVNTAAVSKLDDQPVRLLIFVPFLFSEIGLSLFRDLKMCCQGKRRNREISPKSLGIHKGYFFVYGDPFRLGIGLIIP